MFSHMVDYSLICDQALTANAAGQVFSEEDSGQSTSGPAVAADTQQTAPARVLSVCHRARQDLAAESCHLDV